MAAICGATFVLARAGLLDERRHTSNAAVFLEQSGYAGGAHYVDAPVVTDGGLTTATGIRPVEFSAAVFRLSGLYPQGLVAAWEELHTTGDEAAFYRLMEEHGAFAHA